MTKKTEKDIVPLIKSAVNETLDAEDLIVETLRDMLKDEIKSHIRAALERDEKLREELKKAVHMYLEARLRQVYASMKIAKGATKLGLSILPPEMKQEMSKEILDTLEKELGEMMERGL